jgi:hypothetical protein
MRDTDSPSRKMACGHPYAARQVIVTGGQHLKTVCWACRIEADHGKAGLAAAGSGVARQGEVWQGAKS